MNRPRNRQQRPPREQNRGGRRGPQSGSQIGSVPTIQQVVHGASVSIVLKEDQPTGREVQGSVQDLLTRGNHPRGIKVRLTDGRVGRVQRMATGSTCATQSSSAAPTHQLTHHMVDNSAATPDGPPPRSLADYLPTLQREPDPPIQTSKATFTTATATCPICGLFEGDEVAVSHHVNEHLS
ncbi:uncharacterized protein RCC_02439 [Ramularia collo-cygni]|uniref:UBZ4-type domain-containing protein n=1 Tax=Ramularia collo-cygni TaxID=112498 RepID=A0A2D3USA9_9PEZI|nr:uncharacterized protein RCC_02439 [Ramularia collo-cygni]CZT16605.1 uncharacterized protein RCC_02439 [Ramularia collo-cygni]